jgi:hypothetical protein
MGRFLDAVAQAVTSASVNKDVRKDFSQLKLDDSKKSWKQMAFIKANRDRIEEVYLTTVDALKTYTR